MGLAVVRGLQGYTFDGVRKDSCLKLLACAKHFAVHSGPEWNRHSFNLENVSSRDLWETYLPAFKSLVQEGDVREVMCAISVSMVSLAVAIPATCNRYYVTNGDSRDWW